MQRSLGFLAFVLAAAIAGTIARRSAMRTFLETRTYEDVYYLPDTPSLPVLSLGYREALADLIWLKALVYTGDEFAHRGDLENVFRYADAMLVLDPQFRAVYEWVGTMGIYRPAGVTVGDYRRTIGYLEAGVRQFPDDGELRWELGATLAYELAPQLPPAERTRVKAEAREHFIHAARLGAGPEWLGLGTAMDMARAGQTARAIEHMRALHALTNDPETRANIERRLASLESASEAEAMHLLATDLERRHRAQFPYVNEALFILLAPRIDTRVEP
jgi:hypothetical protein